MLEVATEEVKTLSLDHHGLVVTVCKELKIAERINRPLSKLMLQVPYYKLQQLN